MRTYYRWRVQTYAGRFSNWRGLRWLAPRRTEVWGTADSMDEGLARIAEHLKTVDTTAHVSTSCVGYLWEL